MDSKNTVISLKIDCDNRPFLSFICLWAKAAKYEINFNDLGFEPFRVESNYSSAGADELMITLYPSDVLLRHVAALFAEDVDLEIIKSSSHSNK